MAWGRRGCAFAFSTAINPAAFEVGPPQLPWRAGTAGARLQHPCLCFAPSGQCVHRRFAVNGALLPLDSLHADRRPGVNAHPCCRSASLTGAARTAAAGATSCWTAARRRLCLARRVLVLKLACSSSGCTAEGRQIMQVQAGWHAPRAGSSAPAPRDCCTAAPALSSAGALREEVPPGIGGADQGRGGEVGCRPAGGRLRLHLVHGQDAGLVTAAHAGDRPFSGKQWGRVHRAAQARRRRRPASALAVHVDGNLLSPACRLQSAHL